MLRKPILKRYHLSPSAIAFSTTRQGGYSQGRYSEFNANAFCGDDAASIAANRTALIEELKVIAQLDDYPELIIPHQVHGTVIRRVDDDLIHLDINARMQALEGVDAVMTDLRGVCICVSTADCIPILMRDNKSNAICAVHAGWRGTVARIAVHAVSNMVDAYGTSAKDITAVIGPGISLEAFEVGDEVYNAFSDSGFDMDTIAKHYDKWHIDLWECNRQQLIASGIPEKNISVAGICTFSHANEFFSARRLGLDSGRILNGIMNF